MRKIPTLLLIFLLMTALIACSPTKSDENVLKGVMGLEWGDGPKKFSRIMTDKEASIDNDSCEEANKDADTTGFSCLAYNGFFMNHQAWVIGRFKNQRLEEVIFKFFSNKSSILYKEFKESLTEKYGMYEMEDKIGEYNTFAYWYKIETGIILYCDIAASRENVQIKYWDLKYKDSLEEREKSLKNKREALKDF